MPVIVVRSGPAFVRMLHRRKVHNKAITSYLHRRTPPPVSAEVLCYSLILLNKGRNRFFSLSLQARK